jgi:4-carboxymuconolactone decarboxylase
VSAVGVTPVEAKEIVYQAVPYVGLGRVFDVLHATNDVLTERGVELPLPGQSTGARRGHPRRTAARATEAADVVLTDSFLQSAARRR